LLARGFERNRQLSCHLTRVRVARLDPRPRLRAQSRGTALSRRIVRVFLNIAFGQIATPNTR
jgi:hypothetical protein